VPKRAAPGLALAQGVDEGVLVRDRRRARWVLGVLLVAALALLTLDARDGSAAPIRDLRGIGGAVFGSAESMAGSVAQPVGSFLARLDGGPGSSSQVAALQQEVVRLRAELSQAQVSRAQWEQLGQLAALAGRGRYTVVPADVVAAGPAYEDTVTIDAGRASGIRTGDTVLNGSGLVGTITWAGSRTATVRLITDAAATVAARVYPSGDYAVVTGEGDSQPGPATLKLQVFDASAVLHPGEPVVTMGGWPYAPGVPIGVITRVVSSPVAITKTAYLRPYANLAALGVVGVVIRPPRHTPLFGVLPPRPKPSPAPAPTASARRSPAPRVSATTGSAAPGGGG
jgi:rod shape-determining protein MreC